MNDAYRRARVYVIAACLAVLVTGFFIVRGFAHHITVGCDGVLEKVDTRQAAATDDLGESSGLTIDFDATTKNGSSRWENFRVQWHRASGESTCKELGFRTTSYQQTFTLARDEATNTYDVVGSSRQPVMSFRKVERHGWRFVDHDKLLDAGDVGLLILLGALGSLTIAVARIVFARGYATRIHAWKPGTVRNDGVVESETGEMLGRLAPKIRHYGVDLLVHPGAVEDRGAYRDIPLLEKKDIAWSTHARWQKVTSRRLRDARVLAVIATLTTCFAVLANQFAG